MMDRCLLGMIPRDVFRLVLQHLSPEALSTLDVAMLNHSLRQSSYLPTVHGLILPYEIIISFPQLHRFPNSPTFQCHQIHWLIQRKVLIAQLVLISSQFSDNSSCALLIRNSHCVLKSLTLCSESESNSFNDSVLGVGRCPSLRNLNLSRCSSISETTLTEFLLANSQLERLTIRDMNHLSRKCCVAIAECSNLQHLSLPSNRWLSKGIVGLLIGAPLRLLTTLDVSLTDVTDSDIHSLLESLLNLQYMAVEWYQLSNETLMLCWRQTVVRLLKSETLELQLVGLRNASQILFYRREEIFEEENTKLGGIVSQLVGFLRHPYHPLREEASRVLAALPQTIISAEMVAPILETALEGDAVVKALCRDVILRICDTDLSVIPPDPPIFALFNAFFKGKRRRRHPTQQFARCISYLVKNTREVPLLIDSRLLENFLALEDSPDILLCVVDLIRHSVAQNSLELLSYLVEIGVFSYLLGILYVEPKDELGDIFDVNAVNGLRELIKADQRCRETLLGMDLPTQVVNILIQREQS